MPIEIKLGGKRGGFAIVDPEIAVWLAGSSWSRGAHGYVVGWHGGRLSYMHREIARKHLGLADSEVVDHKDGNPLNNQLSNLRTCSQRENARNCRTAKNNTSGHRGVSWDKSRCRWLAHIKVHYKFKNLGWFDEFEDAVTARLKAEKKYFGAFAPSAGVLR